MYGKQRPNAIYAFFYLYYVALHRDAAYYNKRPQLAKPTLHYYYNTSRRLLQQSPANPTASPGSAERPNATLLLQRT